MGRASIAIPLYFFIKKKINFLWCLLCFGVYTMFFLEEEQKNISFFMKEQTGTFGLVFRVFV
jgi:H+/gluconate symporter-like permease